MTKEINKKPAQKKEEKSFKGKTKSGFKYEIDEENADNYELLEALADIETDPFATTRVVNLFLGKQEAMRLKNHIRSESGIVSATKLVDELKEIFNSISATKNS